METTIKRVGTKQDALAMTGYAESYFDKLQAAGVIPGVSKPTGKKCFYDLFVLQEWLLGSPKKTLADYQTAAANYTTANT